MSLPQTINVKSSVLRVDLNEIPFDQVSPNSILIIRGGGDGNDAAAPTPDMEAVLKELKAKVDASVSIFVTNRSTDVLCIPEEVLNEAGWYKKI